MRLRGRIQAVLDYATALKLRQGDNPARWRGNIAHLIPHGAKIAKVEHLEAMPYRDVPAFVAELRALPPVPGACVRPVAALALEFTILSAARTKMVWGARWCEVNITDKVWTVPPERMKNKSEFEVPLNKPAIELLMSIPREVGNDFIFTGSKPGRHLGVNAMLKLLRSMRGPGPDVHGFRSSFKDWVSDKTHFPRDIAEASLAHDLPGETETERAYRRTQLLEKRRRLMEAWGGYVGRTTIGNVTQLHRKGA